VWRELGVSVAQVERDAPFSLKREIIPFGAFFWPLPSFRVPPATMDDIQLVASVVAGDLLAFRDSVSECAALLLFN
jgi:hypothetical protein